MNETEATNYLTSKVQSMLPDLRGEIARAKDFILAGSTGETETDSVAAKWLSDQHVTLPKRLDGNSDNIRDALDDTARGIVLELSLFQAIWELISSGMLVPTSSTNRYEVKIEYWHLSYGSGLRMKLDCHYPWKFARAPVPCNMSPATDIFLRGIDCTAIHPNILEAVNQSLDCFRRGLYMPATAMLAAAIEATWEECGTAVATKLSDTKLDTLLKNRREGIGKKVAEIAKTLQKPAASIVLKQAGQTTQNVEDAEAWTDVLRDRRNAVHWGKCKSLVAEHADTGTLMMGAPMHMQTLEAIRLAC